MASPLGLPPPEPLKILDGNTSLKWKKFKQKWTNYEIATGVSEKEEATRVATFLTVIGEEAVDVYNTFNWANEGDNLKIDRVLEKFDAFCNPRKNTIYERYVFFSRNQENGESIDHYVTVLKTMSNTCEFGDLKESLIRDRVVFGIQDNSVRERLLRDPDLTLQTAIEKVRSAELTNAQLKQIKADHKIAEESIHAVKVSGEQLSKNRDQDISIPIVNCKYCGRKHPRDKNQCPAYGAKCQKCGKPNHFAAKCKSKARKPRVYYVEEDEASSDNDYTINTVTHHIGALNTKTSRKSKIPKQLFASMKVNNKVNIKFQLDCGATCNILPLKQYVQAMGNPEDIYLQRSNATLTMYNGTVMHPVGKCKLTCTRGNSKHLLEFQVVDFEVQPILSAETCQKLKFLQVLVNDKNDKDEIAQDKMSVNTTSDIFQEYADVFEGIGCLDENYHIEIDPSVKPVIHPPRRVPVTLKDPLKKELDRMVEERILTPVNEPTDWVSSMVTVVKPNKLRICIDPKDLNRAIKRSHYPMPTIEEVATKLSKAKVFTVLDAKSGFWQIKLDEESSMLTTFNTPFGRFRWLRMPFGICSAPEEFQRRMNNTFENLKGTAIIADDLLVFGEGDDIESATKDHDENLKNALQRARERNLKLNKEKVKLRMTEVPYIGHLLTSEGIKPDPKKVEAVQKMPQPTDVPSVKRFLGMVNYLSKFLPNISTITEPLRQLEAKGVKWHWDDNQQKAFDEVKTLITCHPVLQYYDVTKEVTLQCDASQSGVGAALLQEGHPVAFTSRALTSTERNYAQIEKELLAIVHACDRFDQYVFGREITVETDHKPLEVILKKPLLAAPKRLQRMMMQLQKYNLRVVYKRGSEMYIADTLSRAYLSAPNQVSEEEQEFIRAVENVKMTKHLSISPERLQEIQEKTRDDETLQDLKKNIENGWPDQRSKVLPRTRAYYKFRDELSVQGGVLFKGERVIVPMAMRAQMLEKIHSSHIGAEGCLRRAREVLFWPGMTAEIKEYISSCDTCNAYRQDQPKEPLISQPVPDRPWSRVAADLFTLDKKDYIVMVDDYSNYFEVNILNQITSAAVINSMKSQFARHGIPEEVRSDNGLQFASTSFENFAKEWDFKHVTSSPHYPQANGKVENAVKTAKKILKKAQEDKRDPYLALLAWRNTPTEGLDSSPVQRLMGRRTRTLLPTSASLLKPKVPVMVKKQLTNKRRKQASLFNRGSKSLSELKPGDTVRMRPDTTNKTWRKGVCKKKVAPRSYEVVSEGKLYRRNRRHLALTKETVEEDVALPDLALETPNQPLQNDFPSTQEKPPQEVTGGDTGIKTNHPASNPGKPSNPIERRSSRGRLLKTPDYFY